MSPALAMPARLEQGMIASRVPISWILLWELPFWCVLLLGALVPASKVPRQEWFGIPMKITDMLTVASAVFYGVVFFSRFLLRCRASAASRLVLITLALFGYGFVRLMTGPLELEDQLGMAFALLLAAAAPVQAAGILSLYDGPQTTRFMNRLVLAIAAISLLYTAESVLGLGLRTEEGIAYGSDFGMQRVRGPMYGSSTGYFLLLPALGWALHTFFSGCARRSYSIFCSVALLSAFLGLGSRASLIMLAIFVLSILSMIRRLKRAEFGALLLAVGCMAIGFLVYIQADTQRLKQFEDTHRRMTHEMASNLAESEPLSELVLGQGYGSIWPWYRRDVLKTERIAFGDNTVLTGFGPSLYHSHSTILESLVEFGLPGLCWLLYLLACLIRFPRDSGAGNAWRVFALALAISLISLGFDLFIFKEVRVNVVWWLFVVAAFQLPRTQETSVS